MDRLRRPRRPGRPRPDRRGGRTAAAPPVARRDRGPGERGDHRGGSGHGVRRGARLGGGPATRRPRRSRGAARAAVRGGLAVPAPAARRRGTVARAAAAAGRRGHPRRPVRGARSTAPRRRGTSTRRASCPTRSSTWWRRPTGRSAIAGRSGTWSPGTRAGPTRRSRPARRRCSPGWPGSPRAGGTGWASRRWAASGAADGRRRRDRRRRGARRSSRWPSTTRSAAPPGRARAAPSLGVGGMVRVCREGPAFAADELDWGERVKPKRRAVPGGRPRRTPTVRRVRPAITPVPPVPRPVEAPGRPARPAEDAAGGRLRQPSTRSADGRSTCGWTSGAASSCRTRCSRRPAPYGYGVEVADLVDLARLGGIVTRGTSLKARPGRQRAPGRRGRRRACCGASASRTRAWISCSSGTRRPGRPGRSR